MHPAVFIGIPAAAVVTAFTLGLLRRRRVERRASLCEALALAARRAVPLDLPLARAADAARGRRALAIRAAAADLRTGRSLAESLRAHCRREFPDAVAAAISTGEKSGRLAEALESAAAEASRDVARGHRMALAAFYPALLFLGVAALNLLTLEGWMRYLKESEGDAVVLGPIVVVRYGLYAVAAAVLGVLAFRRLRAPVDGVASARFLRTASLSLSAGRPLHAAISAAARTAGSRRLVRAGHEAAVALTGGQPVPEMWRSLPIARATRERLAGATPTGLPQALLDAADDCDAREARRADRFLRWSVPAATMVAGLLVAMDYAALAQSIANVQERVRPW